MYSLLIVEDEPLIRAGLKKYFDWSSFNISTILEATNGKEGLEKSIEVKPDLIITDIRMPEMDGLEMIKAIRAESIPSEIIILTGYNEFEYAKKAIQYGGVKDFLIKPLQYDESYQSITRCMTSIQEKQVDVETNTRPPSDEDLFQQIEAYIIDNIRDDTSLQTIAEHFFYNPSYLSRLFKTKMQLNFTEFVREIKVDIAKRNLENPDLNMQEVSTLSGFSTYKQFLQTFRLVTSMTPTDYRRHLRG